VGKIAAVAGARIPVIAGDFAHPTRCIDSTGTAAARTVRLARQIAQSKKPADTTLPR